MKVKSEQSGMSTTEAVCLTLLVTSPMIYEGISSANFLLSACIALVERAARRGSNYEYGLFGAGAKIFNSTCEILMIDKFADEELRL